MTGVLITPGVSEIIATAEKAISEIVGSRIKLFPAVDAQEESIQETLKRDRRLRDTICEVCNVEWQEITSSCRKREIAIARQLYCVYALHYLKYTLKAVANVVNYSDHTSVIHSRDAVRDFLFAQDNVIVENIKAINERLQTIINL